MGEMHISLSFKMMIRFLLRSPVQFSPSKAIPAEIAPSPMTAMIRKSSSLRQRASAIPAAAEMEVPLCPTSKVS